MLITRPAAEAAATAARVRALGWEPVVAPMLRVRVATIRAVSAEAVLVTSGNALAALAPGPRLLLAVGDVTAERARAAGFSQVLSAGGDAADLVRLVQCSVRPGAALLLATGRGQGQALAAQLRGLGYRVVRRVAYAARPVARLPDAARAALEAGALRAALFLSAETAATFVRILPVPLHPALAGVEALCIGQPAAAALAPLPWGRVRVSLAPTLDEMLALL